MTARHPSLAIATISTIIIIIIVIIIIIIINIIVVVVIVILLILVVVLIVVTPDFVAVLDKLFGILRKNRICELTIKATTTTVYTAATCFVSNNCSN